jgi:signal transduction histidine kinase
MAWVSSGKVSEVNDEEVIIERPDGSRVTAVVNIRPLKNDRGEVSSAINCAYDITERKRVEEHQRFLMGELAHRGGNLLTIIQSIVSRSLSGSKPIAEERNTLTRRL